MSAPAPATHARPVARDTQDDEQTRDPQNAGGTRWRTALLLPAGLALLSGLDAALLLLGLPAPVDAERLPEVHGMLMVLRALSAVMDTGETPG